MLTASQLPESSFKWHHADLRTPLPPLAELQDHFIGIHSGRRAYLCSREAAFQYGTIEVSKEFSDYYGDQVFICYDEECAVP